MSKRTRISRRLMLQGLGGITVGLPWLEEMLPVAKASLRRSAESEVPVRAFNVFFGLGIPSPLQLEGFDGVMEPLKPLADKLLIMRGVDQVRADEPGINAHYDGASAAFTAEPPNGTARAGGASVDQMVRLAAYPDGLPAGMIPSLVAGTYFRRMDRPVRYIHSFLPDGTAAAAMHEQPRDLFARIFGSLDALDENDPRHQRMQRSVLDAVKDQSNFYTGPRSPLGAQSRARLADHFDRIREYEQRVFDSDGAANRRREQPPLPPESKLLHGGQADPGGEGIDITVTELVEEWRLMADLYALAILTDRVRFGSITFLAAGERIRLKGDYEYNGRHVFQFDDAKHRNSSGANACSHEWWHAFNESSDNPQLRAHAHLKMRELAYFMSLLDQDESREANGRTILENSLLTISTESGDGRHNDVKRELSGVFHAITGANGRFKTGQIMDVGAEGLDVYNSMLDTFGGKQKLGPSNRERQLIDQIIS
ncbi:MAG: DUF1552 domain-containing protein [Pirellulaceae bacterium]|nr:DUF1552 domain-containing protein [Pirellulaceae bacterium]